MAKPKQPSKSARTPKVSPLRGMSVEDWIEAKLPSEQADLVRALIVVARKAAPKATLSIKWGQPVFEENGPFAFIKPAKAHITFGFWRGAALTDPRGLLEGGDVMRHVKVRADADISKLGIAAFVREAVALNKKLGDPTKRGKPT